MKIEVHENIPHGWDVTDMSAVPPCTFLVGLSKDAADKIARLAADAARWHKLRALAGYWQNSSETKVELFQDDATRSCFIRVGKETYGTDRSTFEGVLASIPEPDYY